MTTPKKHSSLFKSPQEILTPTTVRPSSEETIKPKIEKHLISGLFNVPAFRQFGVLAAERGMEKRELLREALNDLFIKHGKPPVA